MSGSYRASVVLAIEHGAGNLPAILARLAPEERPDVEFIVVHKRGEPVTLEPERSVSNVRLIASPDTSRIPDLWRDGILQSQAARVALLTAHVVPAADWLGNVLALELGPGDAGVGGYFTNAPGARARDWAIYLLRYVQFSTRRNVASIHHIAADNAVYVRQRILACEDLLPAGFWEPEYHKRFIAAGLNLRLSDALEVEHRNRYDTQQFAAQRRAHGFTFGRDRARAMPWPRLALMVAASPLIPAVLFGKVVSRAVRTGSLWRSPPGTTMYLGLFALHWSWGEARGLAHGLRRRTWR